MKKHLLKTMLLLFALVAGSMSSWAQSVSTLTFTSKCNGSGTADDGVSWTVASDGTESDFDNSRGIHYGTNKATVKYITLTTSRISGTITKIVVNASTASEVTATVGVTVGGSAFGGAAKSLTSNAADYEFTGSSKGEIVVTVTKPNKAKKALYVKSVAVTYSSGYKVTYDANGATSGDVPTDATSYTSGATVTVLDNTGDLAKSGYTFDGWNTKNDGTGTNYVAGSTFEITANTTLYAKWNAKTISTLTKTGTPTKTTYADGESFDPTGLTVTATYMDDSKENVTSLVTWTPNPLTKGTTSVEGTYMGETVTVDGLTVTVAPGSEERPYTVAEAIDAIKNSGKTKGVYVKGIVCEGGSSLLDGAMNYWISDDGSETDKFEIFKGKGLSGADFTATSDVQVGDVVVVYGTITKFNNTTYEFGKGSQLYSLDRPVVPTILTSPATISELEYVTGNGPSAAQTFTVSGSNLTADITLTLNSSDFEMSRSEGSGYTNSLTLTQTAGAVDETTVYVRLKEGLEINDYAGTITLTSADATTKTIDLTGSVTPTLFTWDLSKKTYTTETDLVTWSSSYATMTNATATGETAATSYLGGDANNRTSSRFYKNNTLTITPALGYMITRVVFTATSENYASTLKSSAWTNATAKASGMTVTVTPTDGFSAIRATIGGACGFTAVKVYYQTATATINLVAACTDGDKCYGTYSNSKAFIVPADLTVYEVSVIGGEMLLEAYATNEVVPANTGVLVAGDAGDHNVVLTTGGTSKLGPDNMLRATGTGIDAAAMAAADASCKFYRLTMHGGTQIGFFWGAKDGAAFAVAANKAYLAVPNTEAGLVKGFRFGENTDAISEIMSNGENEKMSAIYDLSGRRVVKPTKGLYIVNGKKVVK